MEEYQKRMIKELRKLTGRALKLDFFLGSDAYSELSEVDQVLLTAQALHMEGYVAILTQRVRRLKY